jgi:hypothetical protein
MRVAVWLAWRGAAMLAFGATAVLAVTLNHPVHVPGSPGRACRAVTAAGPRVVRPGASGPRYLRARLAACASVGSSTRVYLHVHATQPGMGSAVAPAASGDQGTVSPFS